MQYWLIIFHKIILLPTTKDTIENIVFNLLKPDSNGQFMKYKIVDDIVMLGVYPFHVKQAPFNQLLDSFDRYSECIYRALGEECLEIFHMGSTAIKGMPGTPIVDIIAVCRSPNEPNQSQKKRLENEGFAYQGEAPHTNGDFWFFGGDPTSQPGTIGRAVLHVIAQGNPFIDENKAFVDYCNTIPSAFDRYAKVKLDGVKLAINGEEGQKLSEYKVFKSNTVLEIMKEANKWAKTKAVS
jgi:GrpB-like predicted nucleotidyltransferase (UPF0157 family)